MAEESGTAPEDPAEGGEDLTDEERKRQERREKRKKRPKGFAGMISNILTLVNKNDRFKEKFKEEPSLRFVINATDFPPAALVIIENSELRVENVEPEDIKKTNKDGLLQGTMKQIMDIANGKLDPVKAWFTRKIKIRGPKKMLKLNIAFYYAGKELKKIAG